MKKKTLPIMLLAVIFILVTASIGMAQRPDHPAVRVTPDSGGGSSGSSGSSGGSAATLEGMVHGYVYDYSNGGAPQPGIPVILDGGGWQAEAVTNSEGYYRFAGLGQGKALLSLKLPEGTQQVMPGWPTHTGISQPDHTNLAYYWGDTPPMPVVLSANSMSFSASPGDAVEVNITINNRSGGDATDAVVDLQLPVGLTALEANTTNGEIDFSDHRIWGLLGLLPTDQTAIVSVKIALDENSVAEKLNAAAILSYKEQLTPQLVILEITSEMEAETKTASESVEETVTDTAEATVAQAQDTEEDTKSAEDADELIPTTGGAETSQTVPAWPGLLFSIVFIIGLGAAGFHTLSKRRA